MLSQSDLDTLSYYCSNNFLVLSQVPNYAQIAYWWNLNPLGTVYELMPLLTASDRANFFSLQDFPSWYSSLCNKISTATTNSFQSYTNSMYDLMSLQLLGDLIQCGLTKHSLQNLVSEMSDRKLLDSMKTLSILMAAEGLFSVHTVELMQVELEVDNKRWETIGIAEAPTASEIEGILT